MKASVSSLLTEYKSQVQRKNNIFQDLLQPAYKESSELPIVVAEEWRELDSPFRLRKKFIFEDVNIRNRFIEEVIHYETATEHFSTMKLSKSVVIISVKTMHVDAVTEMDREYAAFVDKIYKDVAYDYDEDNSTDQKRFIIPKQHNRRR